MLLRVGAQATRLARTPIQAKPIFDRAWWGDCLSFISGSRRSTRRFLREGSSSDERGRPRGGGRGQGAAEEDGRTPGRRHRAGGSGRPDAARVPDQTRSGRVRSANGDRSGGAVARPAGRVLVRTKIAGVLQSAAAGPASPSSARRAAVPSVATLSVTQGQLPPCPLASAPARRPSSSASAPASTPAVAAVGAAAAGSWQRWDAGGFSPVGRGCRADASETRVLRTECSPAVAVRCRESGAQRS